MLAVRLVHGRGDPDASVDVEYQHNCKREKNEFCEFSKLEHVFLDFSVPRVYYYGRGERD